MKMEKSLKISEVHTAKDNNTPSQRKQYLAPHIRMLDAQRAEGKQGLTIIESVTNLNGPS